MRSVGRLRGINFKLALAAAGLALTAAPALAGQRPSEGAPSHGTAVDRPSGGGGGGGGAAAASSTPSTPTSTAATSSGTSTASSSSGAASAPTLSGAARHAGYAPEPQHRAGSGGGSGAKGGSQGASHGGGEHAVPRGSGSSSDSGRNGGTTRSGGNSTTHTAAPANSTHTADPNADRAVPGWSRPRGDRPATGTAVERTRPPSNGGGVIIVGGGYYNPFFPYGVGYPGYSLGLGFGFYDPWYDPYMYSGYGYGYGSGYGYGYGVGGGGADSYYPYDYGAQDPRTNDVGEGSIRLKVKPRDAKVYVDGFFVGMVDSFDGTFQKLNVGGGHHKVEVKADGYETAEFDVLVTPEQTVTYQGELKRIR